MLHEDNKANQIKKRHKARQRQENGQPWEALENISQTKPDKTKEEASWGYLVLLSYENMK